MTSKIKVDNITDQDNNSVISRCGSTHTVTAEVYKADTIKDTSNNTYINKCGTAITIGGGSDTTTFPGAAVVTGNVTGANVIASGNVVKTNAVQASDGGNIVSQCGTTNTIGAGGDTTNVPGAAVVTGNVTGANLIASGNVVKSNAYQASDGGVIISQSGTTITLGASGDTIQLASGATNSLGGGIQWETTPKTANFNASAGEGYFVDTSSNEVIVTLPTGVAGESVTILDYVSNANTNAIIFAPQSGEKIEGTTAGQGVTANRQATTLTYSGATQGWLVSSAGDSGPIVAPTIAFTTASGSLGSIAGPTERAAPNSNLSPITGTTTFGTIGYSIQSGSLPAGLTINSSTGAFVGTATEQSSTTTSNFTVRITITETGTTSDRDFSITVNPDALYVAASGGTVTTSGDFKIHTFTGPGTFTVSCGGNSAGSNSVDYLVVAGGGGGGGDGAGGGGGGGYRISYPNPGTGGLPVSAQGYPITVGGGGPAAYPTPGANGSNSVFSSITSTGGGGGGGGNNSPNRAGQAGGSGGGGGARGGSSGSGNSPPVSPPQGNPGASPPADTSGGGGGAGGSASNQNGGSSSTSDIDASPTARAGGGGGGGGPGGPGGSSGGGGASAGTPPGGPNASNASANTGGGAGGGGMSSRTGGNGGSGIVIIRYRYQA